MTKREIIESPVVQGIDEIIVYTLSTTPWGGSPANVDVVVYDITDGVYEDVTSTHFPANNPSVSGDVITLSPFKDIELGKRYRIEVKWTRLGSTFEAYAIVNAEK